MWDRVLSELQWEADMLGEIDWQVHFVDSTIVRAHQHSSGGKKGDREAEAIGLSRRGLSTKVQIRAEGKGKPITFVLTPGQRHEATVFDTLLSQGAVRRAGRGRPRLRPGRVVGDKGYSQRRPREHARRRGIRVTIPRRIDQPRTGPFDRAIYRTRNLIERLINRCKQFRRIATRYEKKAENYRAMWTIAAILL